MATYIRPYTEVAGQIARASSVNAYIDTIASSINNLNSQNLKTSAVGTTQLEGKAVTLNKLDDEIKLYAEVFS